MTDNNRSDKYITCSRCKCKYTNDDAHIKSDFGYTRLGERLKTCVKCRAQSKQYQKDNPEKMKQLKHQYWIDHIDDINKTRQQLQAEAEASEGKIKYCNRCYKNKPFDEYVCPNGKTYNACYACLKSRYG